MDKIRTATGKEFECDFFSCIPDPPRLYLNIVNASITDVAVAFSNHAETMQLWIENYYFAQYTRLVSLAPQNGAIKVSLAKE